MHRRPESLLGLPASNAFRSLVGNRRSQVAKGKPASGGWGSRLWPRPQHTWRPHFAARARAWLSAQDSAWKTRTAPKPTCGMGTPINGVSAALVFHMVWGLKRFLRSGASMLVKCSHSGSSAMGPIMKERENRDSGRTGPGRHAWERPPGWWGSPGDALPSPLGRVACPSGHRAASWGVGSASPPGPPHHSTLQQPGPSFPFPLWLLRISLSLQLCSAPAPTFLSRTQSFQYSGRWQFFRGSTQAVLPEVKMLR